MSGPGKGGKTEEPDFRPYADDAAVLTLGGLTIENGTAAVAIHGSLDVTRDGRGLERARWLKAVLDAVVAVLEEQDLPDALPDETRAPDRVGNPFA